MVRYTGRMTANRSRKQAKHFRREMQRAPTPKSGCVFCDITSDSAQLVKQTKHFKIIHNIFPYSLWDSQPVEDHLMIIPIKHTDTLADLNKVAAQEYVTLITEYEGKGYNVYLRAPSSTMKSVVHQHTHLIKPIERKIKLLLFIRRPYVRGLIK